MHRQFIRGLAAGGLLVVLSLALPSDAHAQRSGVEIWEANCGRCHIIQPPNKYNAKDWRSVGIHMAITARLTSAERDAMIAFLISSARTDDEGGAPEPQPQASAPRPDASAPATFAGLTDEQVARMAEYLESLRSGAGR